MTAPIDPRPQAYRFEDMPLDTIRDGLTRVGVRGDDSLVTVNWFEPGFVSKGQHTHPFDQLAFVLTGVLDFFVGDETFRLEAGSVIHLPADVPHGAQPVGDERVLNIDVFAPIREDFRFLTTYQDDPDHAAKDGT